MGIKFFIGIDISKLTLDVAILRGEELLEHCKIGNSVKEMASNLSRFRKQYQCTPANSILCAERMGVYGNFMVTAASRKKYKLCLENALHLKRSMGIVRGKSDKIDAIRIATYAARHYPILKIWEEPRPVIMQLKLLSSLRNRLVKAKRMFLNSRILEKHFVDAKMQKMLRQMSNTSIESLSLDIKNTEGEMERLVNNDDRLLHLYTLMTSVPNIGRIIAVELLIHTNEFKYFDSPRKFASYCGIAPFSYSSGTSLNTKAKISHFANKEIKSLIHIAAMGSLRRKNSKLFIYYNRKVKEGKHKLCVLNAMRNKLIHYVFACVHANKPFTDDWSPGQSK